MAYHARGSHSSICLGDRDGTVSVFYAVRMDTNRRRKLLGCDVDVYPHARRGIVITILFIMLLPSYTHSYSRIHTLWQCWTCKHHHRRRCHRYNACRRMDCIMLSYLGQSLSSSRVVSLGNVSFKTCQRSRRKAKYVEGIRTAPLVLSFPISEQAYDNVVIVCRGVGEKRFQSLSCSAFP